MWGKGNVLIDVMEQPKAIVHLGEVRIDGRLIWTYICWRSFCSCSVSLVYVSSVTYVSEIHFALMFRASKCPCKYEAHPQSKFPTRPTASKPYIARSDCAYVIEQWCSMSHSLTVLLRSHSSIVAAVEDEGSYSSSRRLWSAVSDKVVECTEHSADRNSSSAVPGLWA
jgi:hypothetical protein